MSAHPQIAFILETIGQFRRQEVDAAEVEARLSAVMSALEGDVPPEVRRAVEEADTLVDTSRFTVCEEEQPARIGLILANLEDVIRRCYLTA